MELNTALAQRYSCRSFLDKPVDLETLKGLLDLARRAPSWGNTQPWKVYAAAGQTAKDIKKAMGEAFAAGQPKAPDIPMASSFESPLSDRYRGLGIELFKLLGITRDDKAARMAHFAANFNSYGAPVLVFWTVPKGETPYLALDCGAMVTSFCLAATQAGLGTLIQATLAYYADIIKEHLDIPAEEDLLIGVALGHPNLDDKANTFRSPRAGLDEFFRAKGF